MAEIAEDRSVTISKNRDDKLVDDLESAYYQSGQLKIYEKQTVEVEEDSKLTEMLRLSVYEEIKERIKNKDPYALSILIEAKEKLKHDLPVYANTLKMLLVALKPFYLITVIDLMIQSPDIV